MIAKQQMINQFHFNLNLGLKLNSFLFSQTNNIIFISSPFSIISLIVKFRHFSITSVDDIVIKYFIFNDICIYYKHLYDFKNTGLILCLIERTPEYLKSKNLHDKFLDTQSKDIYEIIFN